MLKKWVFGICLLTLVVLGLCAARFLREQNKLSKEFEAPSTPRDFNRQLSGAEVADCLERHLSIVRQVELIPDDVRHDFESASGSKIYMANPAKYFNEDMVSSGIPNAQLVFVGYDHRCALIFYKHGGYAETRDVYVVQREGNTGAWAALIYDYDVKDIRGLESAIKKKKFEVTGLKDRL